jgi:hypothetical protein
MEWGSYGRGDRIYSKKLEILFILMPLGNSIDQIDIYS